MSIRAGIYNAIKEDPTLLAILNDGDGGVNVYPHKIGEELLKQFNNFITYEEINKRIDYFCNYSICIFQLNAISKNYDDSQVLASAITDLFNGFRGNLGGKQMVSRTIQIGQFELYDKETDFYISPIEIKFIIK